MGPGYPNQYKHQERHWLEGSGEFCNHCGNSENTNMAQEYSQQYFGYNLSSSPQNINAQNIPRNNRSKQDQPMQYTWTIASSYQTTFWTNETQQTRRTLINRPYSSLSECEESLAYSVSPNVKQLKEMVIEDSSPSYSPFGIDIKTTKPSPVVMPSNSYEGQSKTIEFVFNPENESDDEDDEDMLDDLLDAFNSRYRKCM